MRHSIVHKGLITFFHDTLFRKDVGDGTALIVGVEQADVFAVGEESAFLFEEVRAVFLDHDFEVNCLFI